jgi:GcrA cell cycle regulator
VNHETDTAHFREEGRYLYLDQRGRLYDWRDDLWPLAVRSSYQQWTTEDDERLKAFVAQGASIIRVAAAFRRKQANIRQRARQLGCPFPPLRIARKKWADTLDNPWRS